MKVATQNLQKRSHLASDLVEEYHPSVLLAQEISLETEDSQVIEKTAHFTSKLGYGTAIYHKNGELSNIRLVKSPHPEVGGCIYKKTTIACCNGIDFVSFHGYNGQPIKNCAKLVDHVKAVLAELAHQRSAVFAGDFNTWSPEHIEAVQQELQDYGFVLAHSWPYPSRPQLTLDHVFVRDLQIDNFTTFANASDHHGAVFEISHPTS